MKKLIKSLVIIGIILCTYCLYNMNSLATSDESIMTSIDIHNVDEYKEFAINCKANNGYAGKIINLKSDLDFNGNENNKTPIVGDTFKGIFNGNGYEIKNVYITDESSNDVALFEENEGTIKKVVVRSGTIIGKHGAGSIAGKNKGLIEQCANYVNIQGGYDVGGICSWNDGEGVVRYCYNRGNITDLAPGGGGTIGFGGIVGYDYSGSVVSCYNVGIVAPERNGGKSNISGWFWDDEKHYTKNCYYDAKNLLDRDKYFIGLVDMKGQGLIEGLNIEKNVFIYSNEDYPILDMSIDIDEPTNYLELKKAERDDEIINIGEIKGLHGDLEPSIYDEEPYEENVYDEYDDIIEDDEEEYTPTDVMTRVLIVLTFLAIVAVVWILFLLALIGKLERKK
ncbi:MAG: hypothetical protein K6D97_02735 [Clostridia bacterium]|nr:hypothetical protein [Clostridia bacterium]